MVLVVSAAIEIKDKGYFNRVGEFRFIVVEGTQGYFSYSMSFFSW